MAYVNSLVFFPSFLTINFKSSRLRDLFQYQGMHRRMISTICLITIQRDTFEKITCGFPSSLDPRDQGIYLYN